MQYVGQEDPICQEITYLVYCLGIATRQGYSEMAADLQYNIIATIRTSYWYGYLNIFDSVEIYQSSKLYRISQRCVRSENPVSVGET